jgi:hypothetical protein
MFDPAGLREDLGELFLGNGNYLAGFIDHQRARTGGSLVKS